MNKKLLFNCSEQFQLLHYFSMLIKLIANLKTVNLQYVYNIYNVKGKNFYKTKFLIQPQVL